MEWRMIMGSIVWYGYTSGRSVDDVTNDLLKMNIDQTRLFPSLQGTICFIDKVAHKRQIRDDSFMTKLGFRDLSFVDQHFYTLMSKLSELTIPANKYFVFINKDKAKGFEDTYFDCDYCDYFSKQYRMSDMIQVTQYLSNDQNKCDHYTNIESVGLTALEWSIEISKNGYIVASNNGTENTVVDAIMMNLLQLIL